MLKDKTLLVIGAGASAEFGLPIGFELAERISKRLYFRFDFGRLEQGDERFLDSLRRGFRDSDTLNEHLKLAREISDGIYLTSSIDNYIDTHRHDGRVGRLGKACIVQEILAAERSSNLFVDRSKSRDPLNFRDLRIPKHIDGDGNKEPWLVQLVRILIERVPLEMVGDVLNDLMIVSFNYDRCISYCLAQALSQVYHIDEASSKKIVDKLAIVYPYGTITQQPDQTPLSSIEFGAAPSYLDIVTLGSQIKTYTDQMQDEAILGRIAEFVSRAKTLVFLGFAYHPQNMEILNLRNAQSTVRIFGTAQGFSDTDRTGIEAQLRGIIKGKPQIEIRNNLNCSGLFSEFRRSLSKMTAS